MIIIIWIVVMLMLIIGVGEMKFRTSHKKRIDCKAHTEKSWIDDIDNNIEQLSIEQLEREFVPLTVLAMRGSWHLAQNQTIDTIKFSVLLEEEYCQKLS